MDSNDFIFRDDAPERLGADPSGESEDPCATISREKCGKVRFAVIAFLGYSGLAALGQITKNL